MEVTGPSIPVVNLGDWEVGLYAITLHELEGKERNPPSPTGISIWPKQGSVLQNKDQKADGESVKSAISPWNPPLFAPT